MVWAKAGVGKLSCDQNEILLFWMMQKETSTTKQYRWNQTTCFAAKHTEHEMKATHDAIRITGQFSLPLRLERLVQPVGWGSPPRQEQQLRGQGSLPTSPACFPLLPRQPVLLPFRTLSVCMYSSARFACQSRQTEESEERLINQ